MPTGRLQGLRIEAFDIADIPLYNGDLDGDEKPAPVAALKRAIGEADGLLVVTPEYNYGMPGVLKNALDWASRPVPDNALRAKPAAVIGASTSLFGGVWAQAEVREAWKGLVTAASERPAEECRRAVS